MSATAEKDPLLPMLRNDLQFFPGPDAQDGTPTYTIYDPISGHYSKIGWAEATILHYLTPGIKLSQMLGILQRKTTIRSSPEEVLRLCNSANQANLLAGTNLKKGRFLEKLHASRKKTAGQWMLSNYLFFKIPLLTPDRFLAATVRTIRLFASAPALLLYFVISLTGLTMVALRAEQYFASFDRFFNLEGIVLYGCAMVFIKILHEFSHAYVAKAFGATVRSMGIAFMVFAPIPFCDVTDSWRIKSRRKRFLVGFAGVGAELVIAGCSLFLWAVAPPGALRHVFFIFSSVTIISTLLVNINPAMRFDGYYLLTDLSGIENLRTRAATVARWVIYTFLLGVELPLPKDATSSGRKLWMLVYSVYSWIYRFFLYLGIAVLVYYKFTKALGLFLFLVEIWAFILLPGIREVKSLVALRSKLRLNLRLITTALFLLLAAAWFALPLPRTVSLPAVVVARSSQAIFTSHAGIIREVMVKDGDEVKAGDVLLEMQDRRIETEIDIINNELKILHHELQMITTDQKKKGGVSEKLKQMAKAKATLEGLKRSLSFCTVRTAVGGVIHGWDRSLRAGQAVRKNVLLGSVTDTDGISVAAFVREEHLGMLLREKNVRFMMNGTLEKYNGRIVSVSPVPETSIAYPVLTSSAGGEIPVKHEGGELVPLESYYRIDVEPATTIATLPLGQGGILLADTAPSSRLVGAFRWIAGVLRRESGF